MRAEASSDTFPLSSLFANKYMKQRIFFSSDKILPMLNVHFVCACKENIKVVDSLQGVKKVCKLIITHSSSRQDDHHEP